MAAQSRGRTGQPAPLCDGLVVALFGLLLRLGVVIWAGKRCVPAADGQYYHVVAARIARGLGYTWQWPDGTVTFAAHYPVGYPALVAIPYAVLGPEPWVAMLVNAVIGSLAVLAVHRLVAREAGRGGAMLGALLLGLHPSLVGYTAALMTEGVVAALLVLVAWASVAAASRAGRAHWVLLMVVGLGSGIVILVRPQSLLLVPGFGMVAGALRSREKKNGRAILIRGLTVTVVALCVCLPWSLRNCARLGRCVFVSANAGWNLLIGSGPGATGSWVPIEVAGLPEQCRTVYDEAEKDLCFGRAGAVHIVRDPVRWLGLVPRKLGATFDHLGASSGYLSMSDPHLPRGSMDLLRALETVWQRGLVGLAVLAAARASGPRRRLRSLSGILAGLFLVSGPGWLGYLGLVFCCLLLGRALLDQPLVWLGCMAVGTTALTHAVFFGADRYALVCAGLLAGLAGTCLGPKAERVATLPRF